MNESDFKAILKNNNLELPNRFPRHQLINDPSTSEILNEHLENLYGIMTQPEFIKILETEYKEFDNREHIRTALDGMVDFEDLGKSENEVTLKRLKKLRIPSKMAFILSAYERLAHSIDEDCETKEKCYKSKRTFTQELLYSKDVANFKKNMSLAIENDSSTPGFPYVLKCFSSEILPFSVHAKEDIVGKCIVGKTYTPKAIQQKIEDGKWAEPVKCNNYCALPMHINPEFEAFVKERTEQLKQVNPEITEAEVIVELASKKVPMSISGQYRTKLEEKTVKSKHSSYYSIDRDFERLAKKMNQKDANIKNEVLSSLVYILSAYKYSQEDIPNILSRYEDIIKKIEDASQKLEKLDETKLKQTEDEIFAQKHFIEAKRDLEKVYYESYGEAPGILLRDKKDGNTYPIENILNKLYDKGVSEDEMLHLFTSITDLELKKKIIECYEDDSKKYKKDSLDECNKSFLEVLSDNDYEVDENIAKKELPKQELYAMAKELLGKQEINFAEVDNYMYQLALAKIEQEKLKGNELSTFSDNLESTTKIFHTLLEHKLNSKFVDENNEPLVNFFVNAYDKSYGIEDLENKRAERIKYYLQYIKCCKNPEIQIPDAIEKNTDSAIEPLLKMSEALGTNPLDLSELEKKLTDTLVDNTGKTIIDFSDNSLDEAFGIDKLPPFSKKLNRINLYLSFIKQQEKSSYENLIQTFPEMEKFEREETFEDIACEAELDSEDKKDIIIDKKHKDNPIIKYVKKEILDIEEIPEETTSSMKNAIIKSIGSNKISNKVLAGISLKSQNAISTVVGEKKISDIKRIAVVKLAISKLKYSDEHKEYLLDTLKNISKEKYDLDESLFENLEFEDLEASMKIDWGEYLKKLEESIDKDKLTEAASIFERNKQREESR